MIKTRKNVRILFRKFVVLRNNQNNMHVKCSLRNVDIYLLPRCTYIHMNVLSVRYVCYDICCCCIEMSNLMLYSLNVIRKLKVNFSSIDRKISQSKGNI